MINFLKTSKNQIEKYSPQNYSLLLVMPIIFVITGFFIWNIYLYSFGFVEDELLKTKFILTGFFFFLFSFTLWFILVIIRNLISFISNFIQKAIHRFVKREINPNISIFSDIRISIGVFLLIVWFIFYVLLIFPILPLALGGGQPRAISLIANEKTMPILNSLEIKTGDGSTYQTANLCVIHENARGIYIVREDRILMLDNSLFQGFGSIGGSRSFLEQLCVEYTKQFYFDGLCFSVLLFKTKLTNLLQGERNFFGF